MKDQSPLNKKLGILGGGQLGKMLCESASPWHINTSVLDKDGSFPAAKICHHFTPGDFKSETDVAAFGGNLDVVTIEIESVSEKGLQKLAEKGVATYPNARQLSIIKDKGLQNQFYTENGFPTPGYHFVNSKKEILDQLKEGKLDYPFVQKLRTEGYDGRGVSVIRSESDNDKILEGKSIIEDLVPIEKELAVIAARDQEGKVSSYDVVEMVFKPEANLVEYLRCPAQITEDIAEKARNIAESIITALDMRGILAIEFFLTKNGELLVNEVAPRPHNSGHHTIEACYCSQYEQLLRCILGLPLGSTQLKSPAVMVNLLGAEGYHGKVQIEGLEEALQVEGAYIHLYGKTETRPNRKMGHVTVIDRDIEKAVKKAKQIQSTIIIRS